VIATAIGEKAGGLATRIASFRTRTTTDQPPQRRPRA